MIWNTASASNGAACVAFATSSACYNGGSCVAFGKSSFSTGNNACLEYGKSSHSGSNGGGCVEVAVGEAVLQEAREEGVREEALAHEKVQQAASRGEKLYYLKDSKDPAGPVLAFTAEEWRAFVLGVRNGEFEVETAAEPAPAA